MLVYSVPLITGYRTKEGTLMADSNWASYVGMVTGVIGAVMGYISYRKSHLR